MAPPRTMVALSAPVSAALCLGAALALAPSWALADPPVLRPFPSRHGRVHAPPRAPAGAGASALLTPPPAAVIDRSENGVAPPEGPRAVAANMEQSIALEQQENFGQRAPGSMPYYRRFQSALSEQWHPPVVDAAPSVQQAILNTVVAPLARSLAVAAAGSDNMAGGRVGVAREEMERNHPNSVLPAPPSTARAIDVASAQHLRVDVELVQNEQGAVVSTRVVRSSGSLEFDLRAMESVRQTAAAQPAQRMPGGWRSRWAMDSSVSRDPAFLMSPTIAGEPPMPIGFVEVSSDGEVHTPLRVHRRQRIWLVNATQITR